MKKILVLSLALMFNLVSNAQEKIEEGVITMKQTMSSDNEQMNAQLKQLGDMTSTGYFKGDKSRSETKSPMTGDMTIIIDGSEKQMLMLMNQPGMGKVYMKESISPSEEDLKNVKVTKGSETKMVLGYECQQYIVEMMQGGQSVEMEMFVTDKISAISQNTTAMGDKIEGYPLYFVMRMNQMGANMEVTSEVTKIEKQSVADSKFSMTPPEGYTEMGVPKNPMLNEENKN